MAQSIFNFTGTDGVYISQELDVDGARPEIVNNECRIVGDASSTSFITRSTGITDTDITAILVGRGATSTAGIVFRFNDDDDYNEVILLNNGELVVRSLSGGTLSVISSFTITNFVPAYTLGDDLTVRLVTSGTANTLYINSVDVGAVGTTNNNLGNTTHGIKLVGTEAGVSYFAVEDNVPVADAPLTSVPAVSGSAYYLAKPNDTSYITIPAFNFLAQPSWSIKTRFKTTGSTFRIFGSTTGFSTYISISTSGELLLRYDTSSREITFSTGVTDFTAFLEVEIRKVSTTLHELYIEGVLVDSSNSDTGSWTQNLDFIRIGAQGTTSNNADIQYHQTTVNGVLTRNYFNDQSDIDVIFPELVNNEEGQLTSYAFPPVWISEPYGGSSNSAPVADAGTDGNIDTGQATILNGSGSSDPDSDTLTYSWSFTSVPSGSSASFVDATVENPTFTPDLDGTYVIQLIVNDGTENSAPDTVTKTASTAAVTSTLNMTITGVSVSSTNVYDTTIVNTLTDVTRTEPISWTNEEASYTWPEAAGSTLMYVVIIPSADPDAGVQIGDTV